MNETGLQKKCKKNSLSKWAYYLGNGDSYVRGVGQTYSQHFQPYGLKKTPP